MPYSPQRRHAVGIISSTTQALNLLQHLYQPNLLILLSRMLVQMQTAAAGIVHPSRSLFSLCLMLTLLNATAMLLHLLDNLAGPGKGVMLDFVGQGTARTASLLRMLLMDVLIWALQIHSLAISYLNNKATATLASVPELPYADMLLPVSDIPEEVSAEDFDIESGLRRRKGKGRVMEEINDDEEEDVLWLDEPSPIGNHGGQPNERDRLLNQSRPTRPRQREPPRIASISLIHMMNLIIHMPTPTPAPRLFSGATPIGSPRSGTPVPNTGTTDGAETLYSVPEDEDGAEDTEDEEEAEQSDEVARRSILRPTGRGEAEGVEGHDSTHSQGAEGHGRMPGDYWVRGRGNGG